MGIDITSFFVYRLRYWLGYGLLCVLLIGLLVFAGLYTPGGVSQAEMNSVVTSSNISLTNIGSLAVTNLPFHLLQQVSLNLFGISDFSIKLPSLVLALLSAIGLALLLRRWFKPNVALLASIIAITTGQFLFIAQSGTPSILYVFWAVWLLLLGTLIAKHERPQTLYKVLFFIITALSLYTPLSVYALIAMATAAVLHPHLRYIIGRLSKVRLAIAFGIGVILIIPLAIGVFKTPELGLTILGVPTVWPDLSANFILLSQQYLGFFQASSTGLMTPVFGLGSMLLIVFGMYKLIRGHSSTQSYIIVTWLLFLIPVLITNPLFTSVTFLPLVLLLATGLSSLLGYWYRLFPRNPYARIAGLIPLVALVSVLILTGMERYIYGYHNDPNTAPNFSRDLALLPRETRHLVVSEREKPFYAVVARQKNDLTVSTTSPRSDSFAATMDAQKSFKDYTIDRIVTTTTYNNADRFYIYKKTTQ